MTCAMRSWMIAGSLGIAVPALFPWMPHPLVPAGACLIGLCLVYFRRFPIAGIHLLGISFACLFALWGQVRWLPEQLAGQDLRVCGVFEGLPEQRKAGTRYRFRVARRPGDLLPGPMLQLYAYEDLQAGPGRSRCLLVRLKPPRGLANPGGFDYERWLFQRGIAATGYVRSVLDEDAGPHAWQSLGRMRLGLRQHLAAVLDPGSAASGVLQALVIGDRSALDADLRNHFARTGTAHLMAISGLHLALVAGFAFALGSQLLRLLALGDRLPAPRGGAGLALLAGLGYGLVSGWGLPVQRASIMLACALLPLLCGFRARVADVLLLALCGVLLLDPLAVRDAGFWLSFGAVGLLVYALSGRPADRSRWRRWILPQVGLSLGLVPLLSAHGMPVSLVSIPANLLAVPWTGLLVLPLALLGTILSLVSPIGAWLLHGAAWLMDVQLQCLAWLSAHSPALVPANPAPAAIALAMLGMAWLLAPRGVPGRLAGIALCIPLLIAPRETLQRGEFDVHVLDVGQGLAVLVRTRNRLMLYDAGNGGGYGLDAGDAVVLPFLRHHGWGHIDLVLISHGDGDHAGGAPAVLGGTRIATYLGNVPVAGLAPRIPVGCRAGLHWAWDGVEFTVLHPPLPLDAANHNNASCVLQVSGAGGSLLLPGDIERRAEHALVARHGPHLRSELLIAPHHGSRTSSTPAFVRAVAPRFVVFSAAWRGRFGHPHPKVVARYARHGVTTLDTAAGGQLTFHVTANGVQDPLAAREKQAAWWRQTTKPESGKKGVIEYLRLRYWQGNVIQEGS